MRQLLLILILLLKNVYELKAIRFIYTIINFILLVLYYLYNKKTLQYITLALFRINEYKKVFRSYQLKKVADKEGYFNFLKFYTITYYINLIYLLSNIPNLETSYFEYKYIEFIKTPFKLTNKKRGQKD